MSGAAPADRIDTTSGGVLDDDLTRAAVNAGLLALMIAAALADTLAAPPVARALLTLLAIALVPGAAIVLRLGLSDVMHTTAIALGLSVAIDVAVSSVMALLGWWHPVEVTAAIGTVAAVFLAEDFVFSLFEHRDARLA